MKATTTSGTLAAETAHLVNMRLGLRTGGSAMATIGSCRKELAVNRKANDESGADTSIWHLFTCGEAAKWARHEDSRHHPPEADPETRDSIGLLNELRCIERNRLQSLLMGKLKWTSARRL